MLIAVLSGFALAALAPLICRAARGRAGWLIALLPAALFVFFLSQDAAIAAGARLRESTPWVPSLGVNLSFHLDGLSLLMALLVTGIGALVTVYASAYLRDDPQVGRFYVYLLAFMAAMLGLVLADNLLTLFTFWELTSVTSYLLIGYKHTYADSRKAALQALIVTGAGGLALLAGFVLLSSVAGTLEISDLLARGEAVRASALYPLLLLLIGLGAFAKSAQFPFHFWLPGAMAAPTPVSAYLHSATMVKAGVYLLARLSPALHETLAWQLLLIGVGLATMLTGAYLSFIQQDLKRILAYSTVSSLGLMVMLLGWGTETAVEAATLFLLVHSLYKGALFLAAGAIDHATGTRDLARLGGLARIAPPLALGAGLAALAMSGMPPMLGFIGKELVYEATLSHHPVTGLDQQAAGALLTAAELTSNIFAVAAAGLIAVRPFYGPPRPTPKRPHALPLALWIGPLALGALGLVSGITSSLTQTYIVGPAASAIYGEEIELALELWHGLTPVLALSVATIAGGVALYGLRDRLRPGLAQLAGVGARLGPERLFSAGLDGLPGLARRLTDVIQNGYLRYYVATVVGVTVGLVGLSFIRGAALPAALGLGDAQLHEVVVALVMLAGVALVVRARSLLVMVVSLGVVGYGTALLFVFYGAPDLAMTQFSIETLSVVLFVLMLYRLPALAQLSTRRARLRDWLIAAAAGALVTVVVLTVTAAPLESPLTRFVAENSYTAAKGRNVVNVILVDFRGIDTLGEITVLAVAALGVVALLRLRPDQEKTGGGGEREKGTGA
ncbi:MAG: putative monovalent cation/H+ antiporter subunit A [Aggregatilineales bacterium]